MIWLHGACLQNLILLNIFPANHKVHQSQVTKLVIVYFQAAVYTAALVNAMIPCMAIMSHMCGAENDILYFLD